MPRMKLTLEYDGGPFQGWQRQENGPSVQAALEAAMGALEPGPHTVQGAGRTDAGVHATGQVAHLDTGRDWDPFRLAEALNWHLRPAPVAVLAAERVADGFHARFDAIGRRYTYRIVARRAPLVLERGRAWRVHGPLDAEAMRAGAAHLVGRHDFTTFRAAQCQAQSPVKSLDKIVIEEIHTATGQEIRLHFAARSFLHNQVRSLVGTLERVGSRRWLPERIRDALAARDRAACGPVAPPQGLALTHVIYPEVPQ
ncbi:tRNA pseudouridine(38-40) synthase TruA [Paralimibaculum aggregatum]|uniref:tRNA pseudouridine synthase A n=1 Tax=Paralimibaculum aggregatum TaxID=3036245 RepID=A0ABQ6LP49_9RHOB|nr:tRNA pseudouridine(38-40) synthase TruA [Limibaculum sp. NKW23]GMG83023.1 tRNA pseudouridine(38-40) synthase TruA [Limibaculum sp. NKW23]